VALLGRFVVLMDRLTTAVAGPIEELLGLVLSETGYQKQLRESENEEDLQRLANIEELLTVARDFDERRGGTGQLEAFLEETCLVNDTDAWETDADRVTLMTLHASKGLEFPVVYVTAVEEGLLPHERSREHPEQWEEERRLLFVGITRAQQELQLSLVRYRDFRGQRKSTIPSSFLMELPRMEMELESPAAEELGPSWVEDQRQEVAARPKVATTNWPSGTIRLTTAAALANGGQPTAVDTELFRQGMWVVHATFGLGQIIALSGTAAGRRATVDFPPPAGRQRLLLADGSLQPVSG
jgi:DNA helicase-2/ATP-dependent DNA helicase PcrA